jgi:hypothetical protein
MHWQPKKLLDPQRVKGKIPTCDAEDDAPKRHPPIPAAFLEEVVHVIRGQSSIYVRVVSDYIVHTNAGDADQPRDHNRCKYEGNSVCTIMLKSKQTH